MNLDTSKNFHLIQTKVLKSIPGNLKYLFIRNIPLFLLKRNDMLILWNSEFDEYVHNNSGFYSEMKENLLTDLVNNWFKIDFIKCAKDIFGNLIQFIIITSLFQTIRVSNLYLKKSIWIISKFTCTNIKEKAFWTEISVIK